MSSSTTELISLPEKVYERMITLHQIILSSVKEYFKENVQKEIEEFQKLFIREKLEKKKKSVDDFLVKLKNSVSSILPKAAREKFEKEFQSFENHFIIQDLISSSTSFEEMKVEKEVPFDDSKLLPVTGAELVDDQETPENSENLGSFEKSQDLAQRLSDGPVYSNTKPKTREKKKESFEDFLDRMKKNISGPADDDAVDPVLTATEIEKVSTPDEMKKILKNISFGLSKNSMKSSYLVGKALSKSKLIFPECKSNKALVKLCDHIKITDASYAGFLMNFASCCDSYPKLLTIVNVSIKDIKNNFGNIQSSFRNSQYERSFWK